MSRQNIHHCFRRWMSAVWERSHATVLGGNYTEILWWQTLLEHFRTTKTFQMLWNEIGLLVSQVLPSQSHMSFLMHMEESTWQMRFHLPLFALTLFCTSQKPPQATVKTFLRIKGFLFKIWRFHHSFLMRYFKMRIKTGWWKHSYCLLTESSHFAYVWIDSEQSKIFL